MNIPKLHRFEGHEVIGSKIAITNAGDGLSKALEADPVELKIGQTVHVVLECVVGKITMQPSKDNPDGLLRVQTLKAGTATLVDADLVAAHLEEQQARIDEFNGTPQFDFADAVDADDDEDV